MIARGNWHAGAGRGYNGSGEKHDQERRTKTATILALECNCANISKVNEMAEFHPRAGRAAALRHQRHEPVALDSRTLRLGFPRPVYIGRFRYWKVAELQQWERGLPREMQKAG